MKLTVGNLLNKQVLSGACSKLFAAAEMKRGEVMFPRLCWLASVCVMGLLESHLGDDLPDSSGRLGPRVKTAIV